MERRTGSGRTSVQSEFMTFEPGLRGTCEQKRKPCVPVEGRIGSSNINDPCGTEGPRLREPQTDHGWRLTETRTVEQGGLILDPERFLPVADAWI